MSQSSRFGYSRGDTVAAIRDYYQFITSLYLPETFVIEPPEGGWPSITQESMNDVGKTEEVIALLRHLPYIYYAQEAHGAANCVFADWSAYHLRGEDARILTEGSDYESVPPHIVGLTCGGRDNPVYLLDTKIGVVYWLDCPGSLRSEPTRQQAFFNLEEDRPEEDVWRGNAGAWEIKDFFELLKDEFRSLHFIPISSVAVIDTYATFSQRKQGQIPMVQEILRSYGWPDTTRYNKREALEQVKKAVREHYSN
ncbi:hypothetical protein ONZ43_g3857 [Nemania bipapillata]|uniref:Uncharacterized protein n=1 Tax=Nemania bipapillata TaxID=110536 RepID=A0ACC2IV77_9PEZI|nr:hypothetical protein ONZ43_g3857 [Nemania bipapillata]